MMTRRGGLRPLSPGASSSAMPREHRFAMPRSLRDLRSLRFAMLAMLRSLRDLRSHMLEGSKSNRIFDCFCAARFSRPHRHRKIPRILGPLRAGMSKSCDSFTFYTVLKKKANCRVLNKEAMRVSLQLNLIKTSL